MTADDFTAWVSALGLTQAQAADALGVDKTTIQRRQAGTLKIPKEAELATRYLSLARQICEIAGGLTP